MKNGFILRIIASIILSFLLIFIVFSMTNISILSSTDHIIILRYIFSSCIIIIGLIIIFGFVIIKKINDIRNH